MSHFHLQIEDDGLATLVFDTPGKSANIFNEAVIAELTEIIRRLHDTPDVRVLVLLSAKDKIFIAGADIDAILQIEDSNEAEEAARRGQEAFNAWAELPFPTIAAIRGNCAGGGTELSLAGDYILISDRDSIRIGLPETKLGIVPGWGGCSRLPQKIGLTAALDIILAGKMVRPKKAYRVGLADALLPDATFLTEVGRFARRIAEGQRPKRKRAWQEKLLGGNPAGRKIVFDRARKQVLKTTKGHYPAPLRAIEVVRAGVEGGLQAGLEAEARAIGELAVSPICKNLVRLFRLIEAGKSDSPETAATIDRTAVLGAGTMGGGIAQLIADKAGLSVRMKDIHQTGLAAGLAHAAGLFRKQVKRRWLSRSEAATKIGLIQPTLDYTGFANVDLVVEAIVENLEVKQQVLSATAERVADDAVLATNTSSLSIDRIAAEIPRPERVIGMHFFNPVHKMPLVEVVVGTKTSQRTVDTVTAFARRLGKTPVVVQDGPGFLVNRLLAFTLAEAMWLLEEGVKIEDLDGAATTWGLPMGPLTLTDEVGIDVATEVARIMSSAFPDRLRYPEWLQAVGDSGRLGVKNGRGFYLYKNGRRTDPDPEIYKLIGSRPPAGTPSGSELCERLLLPMVNEAARCLADGVVSGAGRLDLAMIFGTGFPPFRGGVCRWSDSQGHELADSMDRLAGRVGTRFAPAEEYREVLTSGGFYARYPAPEA